MNKSSLDVFVRIGIVAGICAIVSIIAITVTTLHILNDMATG